MEFTRLFLAMKTPDLPPIAAPASPSAPAIDESAHVVDLHRRRHEAADALAETLIDLWIADHHGRSHRAIGFVSEAPSV